jgi:peptidoglycan/LPS O-acetylase OafA/YrhL
MATRLSTLWSRLRFATGRADSPSVEGGSDRSGHIAPLTGLRAIAAWLVFIRHTELWPGQPSFVSRISLEMNIGVSIFFVLSGFLITLRYYDKASLEPRWLGQYFKSRFARIFPVFALVTIGALVVHRVHDPWRWLSNLTFMAGFIVEPSFEVPQAWTLTVEECFYASAPILFLLMARRRYLYGLVLPCLAGYALAGLLALHHDSPDALSFFVRRTYAGRILEFLAGAQVAISFMRRKAGTTSRHFTALGVVGLVSVIAFLVLNQNPTTESSLHATEGLFWNYLVAQLGIPLATAPLIWGLATERTWLGRLLGSSPFVVLGRASYGFYLIHLGVLSGVLFSVLRLSSLPAFIVMNGVAVLLLFAYEDPMRRFILGRSSPEMMKGSQPAESATELERA